MFVTRFAPSPTGFLHIGGVRTALFSYLYARKMGGKFILRIEDTDDKRLIEQSLTNIIDGLNWLGLKWDDEPIRQSNNLVRHKEIAQELIAQGKAYYCTCKANEDEQNLGYKYSGKCRNACNSFSEDAVIRLNSSSFEEVVLHDHVYGTTVFGRDNLDDFVLMKAGMRASTFMFANVVDDHDEGVTHVIRGNDHYTNTAKHLMLYKMCEWDAPEYAHLPLINGDDGRKMSKRRNATDITDYKSMGYLPLAILNYLLSLGFTPPDAKILSIEEMINIFDIDHLHKSAAQFDILKLNNINQQCMMISDCNDLIILAKEYMQTKYPDITCHEVAFKRISAAMPEIIKRAHFTNDIVELSWFYFDDNLHKVPDEDCLASEIIKNADHTTISKLKNTLADLPIFSKENIDNVINQFAKENNLKKGELMKLLRAILTKTLNSYSISLIIEILGKEEVLKRFK